jgi:hypothetical protein
MKRWLKGMERYARLRLDERVVVKSGKVPSLAWRVGRY